MVSVQRHDTAAADFYMKAQPWVKDAACKGMSHRVFFDDIDEARGSDRALAIKVAQDICASCPVRIECGEAAMLEETGAGDEGRSGFRAYMTPEQRTSIHRRGGLWGRDPMKVVHGRPGRRKTPPVPVEGDKWSKHHTALARKIVRWLPDNVKIGGNLPSVAKLCEALNCKPVPLQRVLIALVQDGTLDCTRCHEVPATAQGKYVRRRNPRVVGWLPTHLRST